MLYSFHTTEYAYLYDRGAYRPGWQGLKAKPVRVRRCPATVRMVFT